MDQIIDLLDSAAKRYTLKALCADLEKAESTLRNELIQQPGYKLGLKTAILIMKKTGDLSPLDKIEKIFNRISYEVPKCDPFSVEPMVNAVAKLTKEYGEQMTAIGQAMVDSRITLDEARTCLKETEDLIRPILQLRAMFVKISKQLKKEVS